MKKRQFIKIAAGITGTATAATTFKAFETPVLAHNEISADTPVGYNGFLVFIANGLIPQGTLFQLGQEGINIFHKGVMRLSDAEIEVERQQAIAFFAQRFGIDVQKKTDFLFDAFAINPQINYRAYVIAGEKVPASGWPVREGGWTAIVTNPYGVTSSSGVSIPSGSIFAVARYNILTNQYRYGWRGRCREIIIKYRSSAAILPAKDGSFYFRTETKSADYGRGQARGISAGIPANNGQERSNIRTVLTFSQNDGY